MKIDLSGKRAVVTGGSRGIGRAIALACAEAGASVSICARGEALDDVRAAIAAHGVAAHAQSCDIGDAAALAGYIEAAAGARGGIDILVCHASGVGPPDHAAGWPRRNPAPRKERRRCDRQHLVDLGHRRLGSHPALRRGQGGYHVVYPE